MARCIGPKATGHFPPWWRCTIAAGWSPAPPCRLPPTANAARRWLQTQSYVKADHISLLGWSHGGVAALWTVRPTAVPHDSGADFRSAVAFYPSCRRLRETAWSARVATLILIGS